MDIFGTTVTVIQEIYTITIFIKGVVADVKDYDADREDIRNKLEHEFLFLESFKALFFDDDGALMSNEHLPVNLKRDVENTLKALKSTLAEYGLLAAKYNILVEGVDSNGDKEVIATKAYGKELVASLGERIKAKVLDLKKKSVDWALFDKAKLIKTLAKYNEWTERLRQTMSLMLLVSAVFGDARLTTFANSKTAKDLGVHKVAKRQILAKANPPETFKALDGQVIDSSKSTKESDLRVADYQDEWETPVKVVVEYREYSSSLVQATELGNTRALEELKAPIRNLAWLLRSSSFSDVEAESSTGTTNQRNMFTLQCMGYLDQPDQYRTIFVYQLPRSTTILNHELKILTLHDFVNDVDSQSKRPKKPALGHRFFVAHALAMTVLSIHGSGWVHKNISSRGVAVFPASKPIIPGTQDAGYFAGPQGIIPYLTGWGFARPALGGTELLEDFEVEPNFYRHPDRQGHPSSSFTKEYDLYALGVVLLEIGVWRTISDLFTKQIKRATEREELPPRDVVKTWLLDIARTDLGKEMGNGYACAVLSCLTGDFGVKSDDEQKTGLSMAFREKVVEVVAAGMKL